jgi:tricarballylate dehydrogenase
MSSEPTYDLVVIGCGAAGLSAVLGYADAAAEQGGTARIAVLERASREERGGATRWTTARMRVDEDGTLDPTFTEVVTASHPDADAEYCRVLEEEAPVTIHELRRHGVELQSGPLGLANELASGRETAPKGGGKEILDKLAAAVEAYDGAEILYETEGVELIAGEDGAVEGVRARGPGGELEELRAGAVVIACGGFEGNPALLNEHAGSGAGDIPLIAPGVANNRGDGLRMALAVGAGTAGQFDMLHLEPVDPRTSQADAVVFGTPYGIVVNGRGERFFDEGKRTFEAGFESLALEIWRNQDQRAFFIGDQTTLGVPFFEFLNATDVPPEVAGTVGELAAKLGLDPQLLEATVATFNAATTDAAFDPTRKDGKATVDLDPPKSNWAFPLDSPPYFGYPLTSAITFTFGGVRTDGKARVVTPDGRPIPRLYAAGEVTGVFYHEYPVGTSVLRSLTFGRLAGAHAAAERA